MEFDHDQTAQCGSIRKGSWVREEDDLLRKCIQKYGEGNWNQVPLRAGLNRCRKSCRLRWLNYLKPNIKRGEFEADEVDLLIKMHKLLGNRWSLIAGRLPGRTANDIKNYWNTHLRKKQQESNVNRATASTRNHQEILLVRPQPQSFSQASKWFKKNIMHRTDHDQQPSSKSKTVINTDDSEPFPEFLTDEALMSWWQENIDFVINHDVQMMKKKKKGVVLQIASGTTEKVNNSVGCCCRSITDGSTTSEDLNQDLSVDDYLFEQ